MHDAALGIYRALLWCYPAAFRHEYGEEMLLVFGEQLRDAGSRAEAARVWGGALLDALTVAPKEHMIMLWQDLRYACRTLSDSRGLAVAAIASLALGIGANTAIFSLLSGVAHSALPVREAGQLVMLTDPGAFGVSVGVEGGERSLLTNTEFELLAADTTDLYGGMAASQSVLERWPARVDGSADTEDLRGRLVSSGYFHFFGVPPVRGRVFGPGDAAAAPLAVISSDLWMRRFGGRDDVIGKTIRIRRAVLTIAGVMPAEFFGETAGQRPDFWAPLDIQPAMLPGRDWLHDSGTEKVMWLHAFARLRPGVNLAQAEAKTNAVFLNSLERTYGSALTPAIRQEFLNQRLKLRLTPGGASGVSGVLVDPLRILLAAVGLVLLIACANVANLLLARGSTRGREIAVRLSLGATRGRLIRQLLTETLLLAALGGVAGLAAAWFFYQGLAYLVLQSDETFALPFSLDRKVLLFSAGATLAAALLSGLLPAWRATGEGARLTQTTRPGAVDSSSHGGGRWARALVALQVALSLPLVVGAVLLVRTVDNLQRADLGFRSESLIVARVDAQSAGYEPARRYPFFRQLSDQLQRIPGVAAVGFSENGIFSGRNSGDEITVEGYKRTGNGDQGSAWDQVGPGFFGAVGVPVVAGREFTDADTAASQRLCIINQAFARKFFAARNPLGMHITQHYGEQHNTCEIIGVVRDSRMYRIRGAVEVRFYVSAAQPLTEYDGVMFVLRTAGAAGADVAASFQRVVRNADPEVAVTGLRTLDATIARRMARDRVMAQLSAVFGAVALGLAAVGLYGVLSYGVVRRRGEIGIRMALGAQRSQLFGMIFGETAWVVGAGLAVGAAASFALTQFLSSQLYGLSPRDPISLIASIALLTLVAFAAAYLPARRATQIDPMAVLRL